MRKSLILLLMIVVMFSCGIVSADEGDVSFVFAGHIRGPRNFTINSLLPYFVDDAATVDKNLVILGGDTICGYVTAYDEKGLDKEWELVDEYLLCFDVPVYRAAGNHDVHSDISLEVFERRYGSIYYSFHKGGVLFIVLNTTKIVSDTSLNWGKIWSSGAQLPNEPEIPSGGQRTFFLAELKKAEADPEVTSVVVVMSGLLWGMPETKDEWWREIHPLLVSSGKVRLVLSGEAGDDVSDTYLEVDGIQYLRSGWGITDDKSFSLRGTYLQVIFKQGELNPEVYTRFINLTPEYYQALSGALGDDVQPHLEGKVKASRGENLSVMGKVRMKIRDWLDKNIKIYNRDNNILLAGIIAVIWLLIVVHVVLSVSRRKS